MALLSHIAAVARLEGGFFARYPKLLVATLVVALVPAIYTLIYLSSVWDPASHTQALAVGLVNLDRAMQYQGQDVNIGQEVMARLRQRHTFGFVDLDDETTARERVRRGELAFALIIPPDFSSNAVPGAQPGAGRLVVYTSEGNNYQSAFLARRFADDLGHAVNDSLNERRWDLVIHAAAGSQRSVERLRQGVNELRQGAHALNDGSAKVIDGTRTLRTAAQAVDSGVGELGNGVMQAGEALRALDNARPKAADLLRLRNGIASLNAGLQEFDHGLVSLHAGSQRLVQGVRTFRDEADDNWLVPSRVTQGLAQVLDGATQLNQGLDTAKSAHPKLTDGAKSLDSGVAGLTTAVQTVGNNLHAIVSHLPEDSAVQRLTDGTARLSKGSDTLLSANQELHKGTQRLAAGVDLLMASLPASLQTPEGSAQGMAKSVQPQVEIDAPVANQGSSFAPNVVPAALWLGAGIIAFLVHVRVMPVQAQAFSRSAQLLGKMVVPTVIVVLQATLVWLAIREVLRIQVVHPAALWVTLAGGALAFLCIVFALTRTLGDAGKALAMLFLAVQLSSSGGVLPVELSGGWFAQVSPWLPMTWVVKAIKATMFGAYEGGWQQPLQWIAATIVVAIASAILWGRWRFVDPEHIRPAVDF